MAIPLKNGVNVLLTQYNKVGKADVFKIGDVYVFVVNPHYLWMHEAEAAGWQTDAEVHIDQEDIYRKAEDNGGMWDVIIVREQMVAIREGAF